MVAPSYPGAAPPKPDSRGVAAGYAFRVTINPEPEGDEVHDGPIDRLRKSPVGTNDPNIVGEAGPTDVPPGVDPPPLDEQEGPTTYGQPVDPAT